MTICIAIGGISYRIQSPLQSVPHDFADYLCADSDACTNLRVTGEDIAWEKKNAAESGGVDFEKSAILRAIAVDALRRNRLLIHGACIAYEGRGYLFIAPSGTGKTTHIRLWMKHLGERVTVVNGDKPMLRLRPAVCAFGTPWSGKEGYQKNIGVPLCAIVELVRGEHNEIAPLKKADAFSCIYRQCFMNGADGETTARLIASAKYLAESVPVYVLRCSMEDEAFFCSFRALTGRERP